MNPTSSNLPKLPPGLTEPLEPFVKDIQQMVGAWKCLSDINECAIQKLSDAIAYLPYATSNFVVKGTGSVVASAFSRALSTSDWFINSSLSLMKINQQISLQRVAEKAAVLFEQMDQAFLGYIAPNAKVPVDKFSKEKVPFSGVDLIGPGLLMYWCSQKTTNNAWSALDRLKKILTGERQKTIIVQTADGPYRNKENYTLKGLVKDFAMESLFAYGWWTLGDYTRLGVINALIQAGEIPATAQTIGNALVLMGLVPAILKTLGQTFGHELNPSDINTVMVGNRRMAYLDGLEGLEFKGSDLETPVSDEAPSNSAPETTIINWEWDEKQKQFVETLSNQIEQPLLQNPSTSHLIYESSREDSSYDFERDEPSSKHHSRSATTRR